MLQDQECLWEFSKEDYQNIPSFQPVKQSYETRVEKCFGLGENLSFPLQDVVIENMDPSMFIINGLPYYEH